MPAAPARIAALRSLLAARFPEQSRPMGHCVATGIAPLDQALGGGLPTGRLTELISPHPGCGGQTVFAELLRTTRRSRQRVALIDGADGFVPTEVPPDHLRHLIWVRCRTRAEAFAAADILFRDGNYALVVLDLRGQPERELARTPSSTWHRLRHAAESSSAAILVQTTEPLVPAIPWRLILQGTSSPTPRKLARHRLVNELVIHVDRGQFEVRTKTA